MNNIELPTDLQGPKRILISLKILLKTLLINTLTWLGIAQKIEGIKIIKINDLNQFEEEWIEEAGSKILKRLVIIFKRRLVKLERN